MGGLNAAFEAQAKTYVDQKGNASSIFGIKNAVVVNGQYYEAQMIFGAEVKNGEVTTQIGFSADTFGISNPSSGKLEPVFFVENGQVFINEAFINQATIEKLLIGSTIKSKQWNPGTKKGLMLDFNSGKIIASDAEITGEINATKGTLQNVVIEENCDVKGTLYVENLRGDISDTYILNPSGKITIESEHFDRVLICPSLVISRNAGATNALGRPQRIVLKKNGTAFMSSTLGGDFRVGQSSSGNDIYTASPGITSGSVIIKANETAVIEYSPEGHHDCIYTPTTLIIVKK